MGALSSSNWSSILLALSWVMKLWEAPMSKRHKTSCLAIFLSRKWVDYIQHGLGWRWGQFSHKAPIPQFGLGAIFGVMPRFVVVETCSFGLPTNISLGLAHFERAAFFTKFCLGLNLEPWNCLGFSPSRGALPLVPFPFMARFLVKELVVLLESGFFASSHIQEAFRFHDGLG